jgi:hypothetical protein
LKAKQRLMNHRSDLSNILRKTSVRTHSNATISRTRFIAISKRIFVQQYGERGSSQSGNASLRNNIENAVYYDRQTRLYATLWRTRFGTTDKRVCTRYEHFQTRLNEAYCEFSSTCVCTRLSETRSAANRACSAFQYYMGRGRERGIGVIRWICQITDSNLII